MNDDDIQQMTKEFARDPDSMVFLRLGEALRRRGELDAATRIVLAGLGRYPDHPEANDLYARILLDSGRRDEARSLWHGVLDSDPRHHAAHKGLGFLEFAAGDVDAALEHLETSLASDPLDETVIQALTVVRATAASLERDGDDDARANVFDGLEGAEDGLLLVDTQGLVLGGAIKSQGGHPVSDHVAAHLAGVAAEAERAARLLDLGAWEWVVVEGDRGNLHLTQPTDGARLVTVRDRGVPAGRLAFLAQRANEHARRWLEAQRL